MPGRGQTHSRDTAPCRYVQQNYTRYMGDASFLAGATERTKKLWAQLEDLIHLECEKGVLDVDPSLPSTITAFGPGYINKEAEKIVGLQVNDGCVAPVGGSGRRRRASRDPTRSRCVLLCVQTDAPLKRAIKPLGGIGMVKAALESYGFKPDPAVEELYTKVCVLPRGRAVQTERACGA